MTPLCSVCHGSGSDPDSKKLPQAKRPNCPHCFGSGDEPTIYDEESIDKDEELWESTLESPQGSTKAAQPPEDPFDDDEKSQDAEEDDSDDW